MLIDWFTVIAQIVNFLILIWLLKRFLYKPVLKAIADREGKLADLIHQAEEDMTFAHKEKHHFLMQSKNLNEQKDEILSKALEEAKANRESLLLKAREEAKELSNKLNQAILVEKNEWDKMMINRIQDVVFNISQKALSDLSSQNLEEQIVYQFLIHLNQISDEQLIRIRNELSKSKGEITINTAFDLTDSVKKEIIDSLVNLNIGQLSPRFYVEPENIGGIKITFGGYQFNWDIRNYLKKLQENLNDHSIETLAPSVSGASSMYTNELDSK